MPRHGADCTCQLPVVDGLILHHLRRARERLRALRADMRLHPSDTIEYDSIERIRALGTGRAPPGARDRGRAEAVRIVGNPLLSDWDSPFWIRIPGYRPVAPLPFLLGELRARGEDWRVDPRRYPGCYLRMESGSISRFVKFADPFDALTYFDTRLRDLTSPRATLSARLPSSA